MTVIEIKDLTKSFKELNAIDNLTLSINENELFGLLGENGAGKTTLIKILTTLIKKDKGEVKIFNYILGKDDIDIRKIINISPQDSALANNLTVKENIDFFKDIYNINDDEYITYLIDKFKLKDYLNKKVKILSGGYKRRTSILISLLSKPKILFLDEPTLGLDVIARREVWNILNELKNKCTIILTSHYLEEIESLCDNLCVLKHGKLKETGTISSIKSKTNSTTFEEAYIKIIQED